MFSKNAGSFIFQNVDVNVACQSYAFAMQPAEDYRQAQISEFKLAQVSNGRGCGVFKSA